jgi:hypothetical protein
MGLIANWEPFMAPSVFSKRIAVTEYYLKTLFLLNMFVKYLHWIGILACITLIICCFLPWAYYADTTIPNEAERTFTGFYSFHNEYGKPGKFLVFFATLTLVFLLLPKVWAKRTNLFICALTFAYAIKTFILYGSCYNNYCPQKLFGLYLMVGCTAIMLLASAFPNMNLKNPNHKEFE